jgi:hypothetical protein
MKKYLIILTIFLTIPLIGSCTHSFKVSYSKPLFSLILEDEGIDSYHIPVFLVKFALWFSEDSESIVPLFKGSRTINLAVFEKTDIDRKCSDCYNRICKSLESSSYCDLIKIIDSDSRITIKALLNESIIRELVVLIHDNDNFVAISMTGRIDPKSIAETIAKLNKYKEGEF